MTKEDKSSPYPHRNWLRDFRTAQGVGQYTPKKQAGLPERDREALYRKLDIHLGGGNKAQAVASVLSVVRDMNEVDADALLEHPLHALGLPIQTLDILESAGVRTVSDTLNRTDQELLAVPLLGRMKLDELRQTVSQWVQARAAEENRG